MKAYESGPQQNGSQGAQSAYQQVPQPGSPTYTEAWALIEAVRRMAAAIENGPADDTESRNKVREALRLNWRLWTIFQAELTVGNGEVPDEIRENMLSLCKFVDNHTVETLTKPLPEKIVTLIDINRNIASGLLASLENATKEAEEEGDDDADVTDSAEPEVEEKEVADQAVETAVNQEA